MCTERKEPNKAGRSVGMSLFESRSIGMKKLVLPFVGILFAVFSTSAFAADEVKLQKAKSLVSTKYGQSQQFITFEANVENLNYGKQVYAYVRDGSGTWSNIPLSYNRSAGAGREIWSTSYSLPLNTTYDLQFALKYVVNGQTYWDNNGSQNYALAQDAGSRLGNGLNVYNDNFEPSVNLGVGGQTYYGFVSVRNLSPTKLVRIHYSTDNWNTTQVASATWAQYPYAGRYSNAVNPNPYGIEDWGYQLNVGNANEVVYAIEYVVNGVSYWDNNFGNDYRVTFTRQ